MSPLIALTRPVPDSLAACELTHLERVPIDVGAARAQHAAYERALASLGCHIVHLPALHDQSDSVFVEDTAVVLDEIAIVTRPGAESRRGETASVAEALARWRPVCVLDGSAMLDGGDVLRLGRTLYVGIGSRSNPAGAAQLAGFLESYGYVVQTVEVGGCLHLKSAVTQVAPDLLLVNPAWTDARVFEGYRAIEVAPSEPFAGNVLRIGESILSAAAHRLTNTRLQALGLTVTTVDVSELAKAEAGVTCCSVIFSPARADTEAEAA